MLTSIKVEGTLKLELLYLNSHTTICDTEIEYTVFIYIISLSHFTNSRAAA